MEKTDETPLIVYTIYDHPSDYPNYFVLRRWAVSDGKMITRQGPPLLLSDNLDTLRQAPMLFGLVRCPRTDDDDPVILESYI